MVAVRGVTPLVGKHANLSRWIIAPSFLEGKRQTAQRSMGRMRRRKKRWYGGKKKNLWLFWCVKIGTQRKNAGHLWGILHTIIEPYLWEKQWQKKKRIRSLILSLNNHSSSLHQKNLLFRNILCIWPCRQPFFFFSEYYCLRLVYVLLFEPDSSKWQQRVS